tara:strand:+ start:146 stop:874 length:729 start_codon:yes stop_codon:yes gene_type:complete
MTRILILVFLFSCSQKSNILDDLNPIHPNVDSSLFALYSDCENFNIPDYSGVGICFNESPSDTVIYLSEFDSRVKIQLNIEWEDLERLDGVTIPELTYINIIKDEKLLKKINLELHMQEEATEVSHRVPGPSLWCKVIDFMDINLDSYLDIRILSRRGNSNSFYSFWVYSPLEEVFHYWDESPTNLVNFNCKDQMIYSVDYHTASYTLFTAYKIDSAKQLQTYAEQEVVKWGEDEIIWKLIK